MKIGCGVCVLLLSGLSVSAVYVDVRPNRQQFFKGSESFTMSCADVETDGWTVKRTARDRGTTKTCGNRAEDFGRLDGVSCIISPPFQTDSGVYWCENSSGQQSEQVTIIVTDRNVILDIPALPVQTGSDVTLRCRGKDGSTVKASFFKNDHTLTSVLVEEWTISADQLSEEDQYDCYVANVGDSPKSSLRVKVPTTTTSDPSPSDPSTSPSDPSTSPSHPGSSSGQPFGSSNFITSMIAAVVSLVLLVLLVLVLLLWKKHKGNSGPAPPADVTYADVTVAQAANRRDRRHEEAETVYAGIKTNTEGAEDVTYSHVVIKGHKSSRQKHALSCDPDVVYSSVRLQNM